MAIDPRNQRYKDAILNAPYEICIERARYYTQSFRRTEGEHPALRAAKAFAHTLRNMTIEILPEESLVGNRSSKMVAAVIPVERGDINSVLELELDIITKRERQPFRITAEEAHELQKEILPYWRGKTLRDRKKELWKQNGLVIKPSFSPAAMARRLKALDHKRLGEITRTPKMDLRYILKGLDELAYNNPALVMNVFDVQGHMILGQKNILHEGFGGVKKRAQKRLEQAKNEKDSDGAAFLEAVVLSCDAVKEFGERFAVLAEAQAEQAGDKARRDELLQIAARCRRVPFQTPRDFREAMQSLWLTQAAALVAYGMTGIFAIGRFDQYLYPFFAKDKKAGRITDAEAVALLEELLLKLSYNLLMLPYAGKNTGSELGSDSCSPTVGGLDRNGKDAVNELSYLILDAFTNVKATGNSFTVRLSEKSPAAFWKKALGTYRVTSGAALFNDEIVVPALQNCGMKIQDARDYGAIGCVEPTSDGDTFGCTSGNDISLAAAMEMTLLNGHLRIIGKRVGPATGDPRGFATFAQFMGAYKKQVTFMVDFIAQAVNLKDQAYRESFPNPFVSATVTGCVENGRDMTQGGAKYNFGSISARGLGTAVDSLAAIKRFVYDQKAITMAHLLHLLDNNFANAEPLRALLANKGPKYGCDDDEVDDIAREVADYFCRETASRDTIRGGPFRPSFFSYGMHVLEGAMLGATPNGRKAGEPISNSFSPSNGAERKGPTAMLRSVAKVDHRLISNGCSLNLKLSPALFAGEERLDKMVALVKGFFSLGGMEMQPNVVDNATLLDAQTHPQNYRDLVVRVSGYSAYFADLGKPLQDEIIKRTQFDRL